MQATLAARPELAVFKRRIEAVHGLVAEAACPDRAPLHLSPERRAKLLQTIGVKESATAATPTAAATPPKAKVLVMPRAKKAKHPFWTQNWFYSAAACVVISIGGFWMLNSVSPKHPQRPDPDASYACSIPSDARYERDTEELPEPMSMVGVDDIITVIKPSPPVAPRSVSVAWSAPSKQTRALADAPSLPRPQLSKLAVEVASVRSYTGTADDGTTGVMEPFEVTEESNIGYAATSTLAGTRLRTELRDVGSALSVAENKSTKDAGAASSDSFLSKRKIERPAPKLTGKGGAVASPAPAAPAIRHAKERVEYSPFGLNTKGDKGYIASTSLPDTRTATEQEGATTEFLGDIGVTSVRMHTEIRDIGAAVTVDTDQFLKDTGATDNKSLLEYSANTEFGGARGNFLSKRKTERAAPKLASKGGAEAPAAPAASEDDKVVLSPFEVSADPSPGFLKRTTRSAGQKQPKRPDPMATSAAMGPGDIPGLETNAAEVEPPAQSAKPVITEDKPLPRPAAPPPPVTIEEVSAAQEAISTFSLHVSDVSFKLALAALASGTWPDRATIRPEEFYNAFDYGDPATAASEKISCRIEQAAHPFAQQRNLVRIAMRVPATGRGAGQPLHLTVLLDTSGSMERPDRHATVRSALATLVGLLGPADRLTLVGFARQPRLLAEALDGNHANQALDLLDRTPAEGGTNLEEALKLGGELAHRHFETTAQNRIVLLTDGAANLGNADPDRLSAAVEALRAQRIAFDACGVGLDGLDDTILEALTRKGDGRYYVLNSPESADAGFARQLAGALRPAAENVKVQVRFNPARVGRYRLVGFEKHRLREEDFRNDAVDAAELAAEEAAVAVYEIEAKPQGEGEVGEVFVRFRDAATKEMVERSWTLPYDPRAAAFDRATPSLQLAGTAAMLAEKIRGGPAGDRVELDTLAPIVSALRGRRPDDQRLQELSTIFEQLRRLQGR
ncbi:MAG: von Willebrand factor type A domain-containing protein [Opitutaceae bacterium]|nr:von Willebrand factor type A domain-containing protein [Opitutaceae bacterium]